MLSGFEEDLASFIQRPPMFGNHIYAIASFVLLSSDFILPIPSSIVMFGTGWVLGLPLGFMISMLASLLSSMLAYGIGKFTEIKVNQYFSTSETQSAKDFIRKYGDISIVISRGIPVLSETISIISGNNSFPHRKFIWANLLGYAPVCFAYNYLGSISSTKEVFLLTMGANLLIAGILYALKERL
jgi:uncharacterized membrane protein YdjX (TVP38/TMEM64 family)